MDDEIQKKLQEFHEYNDQARKHFRAYELKPGEPLHVHTEADLMQYSKWRTKADIALNEFHLLLMDRHPGKLPWSTEQIEHQNKELHDKLAKAESWLKSHNI